MQVPTRFFRHLLYRLGHPSVDSVRDVKHRRQPMITNCARRISYKIYDEEQFAQIFHDQNAMPLKREATYSNEKEIEDITEMDPEEALLEAR